MDSTQRFSSRVATYLKYRPHYPKTVIEILQTDCQLTADAVIADIGSGTGFLSELFLKNGNLLYAVEPNREMRQAGETYCHAYANFRSVDGTAEATTLPANQMDFVVAAQAFHWFDPQKAAQEFVRILKPDGWVVLIWNDRDTESTPFLSAYEQLLQDYAPDYPKVNHKRIDNRVLSDFFGTEKFVQKSVDYRQLFDYESLKGRLMSCSYAPEKGQANHAPMLERLAELFDRFCDNLCDESGATRRLVPFLYKTRIFYGPGATVKLAQSRPTVQ